MKLLTIYVSPKGEESASRRVAARLVDKLTGPDTTIVSRDLSADPLPHLDSTFIKVYLTYPSERTPAQAALLKKSDELVDELLAADTIVISTPMWNFGPPSALKAWIDHIVRLGRTVSYGENGFEGLVTGKKIYVIVSSGQVYSSGPMASMDLLTPALKAAFAFIGAEDSEFIRVEGTNPPDKARVSETGSSDRTKDAIPNAVATIERMFP